MATGWTISMGASGAALADYRGFADFRFVDYLYDYGAATIALTSLDGNSAPVEGWIVKIIYDKGLSTEQTHWQGFIASAEKKQQGNVYSIQAYTLDGVLQINQTGAIRNYLAKTPYAIIQTAGTPNPLLVNAQGNTVMTYGSSASVPNKVETTNDRMGTFSGTIANDQYVAHTKTLLDNVKRLCWQARYTNDASPDGSSDADTDGSYRLEWTTTLEGANNSSPRFYLVKRRESRASYTPEVFNVPSALHRNKRGNATFPGVDTVMVVGAGDGNSRQTSILTGSGTRELVIDDKAIYKSANANNLATGVLQVYDKTIEAVNGITSRHASPTRAGDTITLTQTGYANTNLRVMQRFYDTQSKLFTFILGRPQPKTRELLMSSLGFSAAAGTAPQYTDFQVPGQYDRGVPTSQISFNTSGTTTINADTTSAGLAQSVTVDGDVENYLMKFNLVLDSTSGNSPGNVFMEVTAEFNSSGTYRTIGIMEFGGELRYNAAHAGTYTKEYSIPFKLSDFGTGATNITSMRINIQNQSSANIKVSNANCVVQFWYRQKHRHNEL